MTTEIADGIYRIESIYGGRTLNLYVFAGTNRVLLVDSGAASTASETLLPSLDELGLKPDILLVTHPDLDHQGGNSLLRQRFPDLEIICGAGDEGQVSSPQRLIQDRYSAYEVDHGIGYPAAVKGLFLIDAGVHHVQVDRVFAGGETIGLADDWRVRVLHVPGHSKGHLAVFDPRSGICVVQDCVQGRDYPMADGSPWALMPTYLWVEPYLETVERLRRLEPKAIHSAHWPVAEGDGQAEWLDETRDFALEADRTIFEQIDKGKSTLRDLIDESLPRLGKWDASLADNFAFAAGGHLERYVDAGLARAERKDGILHYEAVKDYQSPVD